ncbi:MAG: hypothetical protein AAF292_01445 [Pseudomonadota bacterium]
MSFTNLILALLGGAAVVAAVMLEQPILLFVLFLITGVGFVVFANRQSKRIRDTKLSNAED